jgi:glycosyltransferase involved in cell wall biosynthesis
LKICIGISPHSFGGPSAFAYKFAQFLHKRNIPYTFDLNGRYDVLLAVATGPDPELVKKIKEKGTKVLYRINGVYLGREGYLSYDNKVLHQLHNFADKVIYQSKFSIMEVREYLGVDIEADPTIIYNGVDTSLFSPEGEKLEREEYEHVLLSAGLFRPNKRAQDVIDAMPYILEKFPNTLYAIVGPESYGDILRTITDKIKYYNIKKNAVFIGPVEQSIIPIYYRSADIFMHLAWLDPCPNTVIEAMACGLPVIHAATGGTRELINEPELMIDSEYDNAKPYSLEEYDKILEKHGGIPQLDPAKIAKKTIWLLEDKKRISDFGGKAIFKVKENYSLEKMGQQYVNLSLELMKYSNHRKIRKE